MPGRPLSALVNMGVYVFKTDVLRKVLEKFCGMDQGHDFGHDIIPFLIGCGRVSAYDFRDETSRQPHYWRDIGTVESYYEACMDLIEPVSGFNPFMRDGWRLKPLVPVRIGALVDRTAKVCKSILSSRVCVGANASLENSILLPGARVERDARLRRAIVEEGAVVPRGFEAGFDLEEDRSRLTVTDTGIVIITGSEKHGLEIPKARREAVYVRSVPGDVLRPSTLQSRRQH
jgi:glucose-1-phosphate adenylyltransferase